MDPVTKFFLNSLKCPLCGAMIDIISVGEYNYCCAADSTHYTAKVILWDLPLPLLAKEKVRVYDGSREYEIIQTEKETVIYVWKVDEENNRIIEKVNPPAPIQFQRKLFTFSQTTRERVVNRVKTILVFQ